MHVVAPGRVNLIGEHTDHAGGLALPMAIGRATTVDGSRRAGSTTVVLRSDIETEPAVVPIADAGVMARDIDRPTWVRLVAAVVAEVGPPGGFRGEVRSTLPVGAGLSSSASFAIAVALAVGADVGVRGLAELAQRAEQLATGVPCGLLDQLAITAAVEGHALLIDFTTGSVEPVPVPDALDVVIVDSGQRRRLLESRYRDRQAECVSAAAIVGSLHDATTSDLDAIDDPVLRRRGRHVVTENARVRRFADALVRGDGIAAGSEMDASHASLRDDFEVSTPELDALVDRLRSTPGVHGCRLTGAGFGGCVVALTEPGALDEGWVVHPAGPARVTPPA